MPILAFIAMKGEFALRILEAIGQGAIDLMDVVVVMSLPQSGFGHSLSKTMYHLERRKEARHYAELDARERRVISTMISRMKREGILKQAPSRTGWLTALGKKYVRTLREKIQKQVAYKAIPSPTITIVAFDIPEKHRRHRDWLRSVVKNLGFTFFQKSVAIGRIQVPEALIYDLDHRNMLRHVHIFSIRKNGTLETYVNRSTRDGRIII